MTTQAMNRAHTRSNSRKARLQRHYANRDDRAPSGGFTIVEVTTIVAIIGILALIAVPIYNSYITNAYDRDALARCEMIGAAVMQLHNQGVTLSGSPSWNETGIANPSDNVWTYAFPAYPGGADDTNYTITATGIGAGPRNGTIWHLKPYKSGNSRWY